VSPAFPEVCPIPREWAFVEALLERKEAGDVRRTRSEAVEPLQRVIDLAANWCRQQSPPPLALPDQGGTRQGEGKKQKRGRGRKPDTDPKADKRVWDAWESGEHEDLTALGNAFHMTKLEVRRALDRHRKRLAKRRRRSQATE
jgi:hypothetical protein